jgi:hypothetical protein
MDSLINFVDVNGKEKHATFIKLINHPIRDAINETTFDEPWVEIHVVGRVRGEWTEYMPLKDFAKLNPELGERLKEHGKLSV